MNDEEKKERSLNRYAAALFFLNILKRAHEPIACYCESTLKETGLNVKDGVNSFKRWIEDTYKKQLAGLLDTPPEEVLKRFYFEWVAFLKDEEKNALNKKPKPELTQRQKAIVLYFKAKANDITHPARQDLIKEGNGSHALYNAFCDVQKGKYNIDDLETAIEFLTEFPAAHALAIDTFKKS
jgi:hypothetical protein